jgi:hypothetical protein
MVARNFRDTGHQRVTARSNRFLEADGHRADCCVVRARRMRPQGLSRRAAGRIGRPEGHAVIGLRHFESEFGSQRSERRLSPAGQREPPTAPRGEKKRIPLDAILTEIMNHFQYRNGVLHAEDVSLAASRTRSGHRSIAIRPRRWSATIACSPKPSPARHTWSATR